MKEITEVGPNLIGAITANASGGGNNGTIVRVNKSANKIYVAHSGGRVEEYMPSRLRIIADSAQEHVQKVLERTTSAHRKHLEDIGKAALAAAREHGWCDEVRGILSEQSIPVPNEDIVLRLQLTVDVTVTRLSDAAYNRTDVLGELSPEADGADWLSQSINVKEQGDGDELFFEGDSDFDFRSLSIVSKQVTEVREALA